jgi:hypothetical protein
MKEATESLGRLRAQGIALLAVVFLIGGLGGAAVERARDRRPPHAPGPIRGHGLTPELHDELGLSPDQDAQIRGILDGARPRVDAVLDRFLPSLQSVADSIRFSVRSVLTPEQQRVFDLRQPSFLPPVPGAPRGRNGPPAPGAPPKRDGPASRGAPPIGRGNR